MLSQYIKLANFKEVKRGKLFKTYIRQHINYLLNQRIFLLTKNNLYFWVSNLGHFSLYTLPLMVMRLNQIVSFVKCMYLIVLNCNQIIMITYSWLIRNVSICQHFIYQLVSKFSNLIQLI